MEQGENTISESKETIGVLLLGFGGPDSLKAVEPFLENLFSDPERAKQRAQSVIERYKQIGGNSPLLKITRKQAQALEERLNEGGGDFKVFIGMRYWHPFIEEAVQEIFREGINRIIALSLSPHYARTTTGSSFKELKRVLANLKADLEVTYVNSWYDHPAYLDALAEKIEAGLSQFSEEQRKKVQLIFTAHSLPKAFVETGDPYLNQLKATIAGVLKRISPVSWRLSFQSRTGPGEWLEPETNFVLDELAKKGYHEVLMVPISFISDHVEILYDIDIVYRKQAQSKGITAFRRTESLNASPKFIEALAQIVREHLIR